MAINGLVVMTPTSVAKTGGSSTATINADGSVTFGACATLSLNGVFTSAYDNYMIVVRMSNPGPSGAADAYIRLRASGTDNSTASSYVRQLIQANGTAVSGARATSDIALIATNFNSETQRNGLSLYLFGPYLAQPTAGRSITVSSASSAYIGETAFTHNQSAAYDGITFSLQATYNMSGLVTVFGFNQ